jgi:hypothetical protein
LSDKTKLSLASRFLVKGAPLKAYGFLVDVFVISFRITLSGANINKSAFLSCLSHDFIQGFVFNFHQPTIGHVRSDELF